MDIIFIEGLSAEAIIGCLAWERRLKQRVVLDIALQLDTRTSAKSDNLADTLDYAALAEKVTHFVSESQFHLIEALAQAIADMILSEFSAQSVKICLQKPGAIPNAKSVKITIERNNENNS